MTFEEFPFNEALKEGLQAMNFEKPTPVQEQTIPVILAKRDVISCAQTGTGKTAAFLLPLLNNLMTDNHDKKKVNAIIMSPTRELAQQIDQQMEGFSYFLPISSVAVYGGNDSQAWDVQRNGLTRGADVVIATPGRMLSHINLQNIDFSGVKYLILDEADRMLDMGFFDDIMRIVKLLPADRQTIMFSATMPHKIRELAKTILNNPVEIKIAIARPPDSIMQAAYICTESQKLLILKHLFSVNVPNKVIIFAGKKQRVRELALILKRKGLPAEAMHSDLEQRDRDHVMHEFRNGRINILVATDIVARGIDIDDITLIINYEAPRDVEDYVHRIGRTARAEAKGMAITLVSEADQPRFKNIEDFLEKTIYKIPLPPEVGLMPAYNPKAASENSPRGKFKGRTQNHASKQRGKQGGKHRPPRQKPNN
ncbi:MAG: DEAD/DEAH box helicase [Prevotellaceae bacterium]|jgi:superfamily II DNA/RNA helicase|nr:DEAD/DEAH box helicase [Prevotellaceae bacterium]